MTAPLQALRAFDMNAAAAIVHEANQKWWLNPHTGERIERNPFEILALVHSELSEALEGERKSRMDDHLPHRPQAEVEMADTMIRLLDCAAAWGAPLSNFSNSLIVPANKGEAIFGLHKCVNNLGADAPGPGETLDEHRRNFLGVDISTTIHRVMSYCVCFNYDLLGAYEEKMAYNAVRADHTLEARRAAGGKAF